MRRGPYRVPEGFLTIEQVREELGVSRDTLWRILRENAERGAALPIYLDPTNRRVKLVKTEDLAAFRQPVLAER